MRRGGQLLIVDNLAGDEFCDLAATDISAGHELWEAPGFSAAIIATAFGRAGARCGSGSELVSSSLAAGAPRPV